MSKNPLLYKFILILVVVGGAVAFGFPLKDRISLGLDLRGGAHILMQVDTRTALKYQLDQTQDRLGQVLKDADLTYDSIVQTGDTVIEVRGTDSASSSDVRERLLATIGDWTLSGSDPWRITMPADQRVYHEQTAIDMTLETIRTRIDALGVAEPLIQKQGLKGDRILVQLPGLEDTDRIKRIIQEQAVLSWKEVSYPQGASSSWGPPTSLVELEAQFGGRIPDDTEVILQETMQGIDSAATTLYWPLKRVSVVSGSDLRTAFRSSSQWGNAAVSFTLTQDAGKRFERATKENIGRRMAIVLDDKVLSAPNIRGAIRDQGVIEGGFTIQSAEDLALKLRSGAIPTKLHIIEERTVGPSLGLDSIRAGLMAGSVGFVGVLLFMVVYYRMAGVNAVVALALNIVLVFGALGALPFLFATSGMKATLTLPGIAGLILTVGMAVDANVLIFERIREEVRLGKTVRAAVDQGFGKAFMTIIDCNVTTVVAAIFLAMYGTGPVRGFAVTLIIGLSASMFTAVFVSRQLFELVLTRKQRVETLSI